MHLTLHVVGRRMPGWVQQGVDEYVRRLPRHWQFSVREIPQATGGSVDERTVREAENLLAGVPEKARVVALDNRGSAWSTVELAQQLEQWQGIGKPLSLLIGGPDGLHERCRQRADQQWSLSALTFPHPLVRIVVAEQLYRAHSLLNNHPYHRA